MASDLKGMVVVIMGVSGAGKSPMCHPDFKSLEFASSLISMVLVDECTIGELLAKTMNCSFHDADDYHPLSNKEKMQKGIPLSDEDRIPWLETLGNTLRESLVSEKIVILACSALQRRYRDILRSVDPNYEAGSLASVVKFVLLDAGSEVLAARLEKRAAEGKHFMPAELLQSQLDLLQIDESEGILKVDATLSPQTIVSIIHTWIL
ncbi:gluconokinase isoform X1 [Carya illinoinensis]|nr:gluconokinase isoform X1 [Carya illinoinensis]XP_042978394.1 gluconokinase isoform X1 [Carya illinoinensis]